MGERIAILPMRAGSKRLPNKHMRNVTYKGVTQPIYRFALEKAIRCLCYSSLFDRIVVSTNDEGVLEDIYRRGYPVFLYGRPDKLYEDDATIADVCKFLVANLQTSMNIAEYVTFYSHSVFFSRGLLEAALLGLSKGVTSVICAYKSAAFTEYALERKGADILRRKFIGAEGANSNEWDNPWYDAEILLAKTRLDGFREWNTHLDDVGFIQVPERKRCSFHTEDEFKEFKRRVKRG